MRLIDADALKEIAHEMIEEDPDAFNGGYSYDAVTVEEIDNAPTIDAVPVVHGEWIVLNGKLVKCFECSECYAINDYNTRYCPFCGAYMRKGGNRK